MSDVIVRGSSIDGSMRVFAAVTTDMVEQARKIHNCYPVAAAALGRTLTIGSIMGATLKNDTDSTTVQISGSGPLGRIVVVTDSKSRVRGYVENPFVELPLNSKGKLDVGGGVGKGRLCVIRDLGLKEPYVGQVPLVNGEIAEDMTYYFAVSEQIPTAIGLGVLVDTDGSIICSGGFMIQLMPEASEQTAAKLEETVKSVPSVTSMIQSGMSAENILFKVTDGFDMLMENKTILPQYHCNCSKERMERALISIGKDELSDIITEQGSAQLTCQFCDNQYTFGKDELLKLLQQAK